MFKIITPDNRGEYRDLIHAMHEMRYRIVVEEWGWHIPGIREGYDKDQFDTDATFYVLVLSRDGDVLASSRLNPTTRPHMMSELFADYCDLQPYPVGADVWECSRFVTDRKRMRDPVEDFRTRCRLGLGLTVWCLDHGVSRLSSLTRNSTISSSGSGQPSRSGFRGGTATTGRGSLRSHGSTRKHSTARWTGTGTRKPSWQSISHQSLGPRHETGSIGSRFRRGCRGV